MNYNEEIEKLQQEGVIIILSYYPTEYKKKLLKDIENKIQELESDMIGFDLRPA